MSSAGVCGRGQHGKHGNQRMYGQENRSYQKCRHGGIAAANGNRQRAMPASNSANRREGVCVRESFASEVKLAAAVYQWRRIEQALGA